MTSHLLGAVAATPPLVPSPTGLYASARKPDGPDQWTSGITYRPGMNVASLGYSQCGTSSTLPTSVFTPPGSVTWQPVVQVVSKRCSTIGWQSTDWRGELKDLMAAGLSKFIETELWSGAIAQREGLDNLWLASTHSTDLTPVPGTAVSLKRGYEILEEGLGDFGVGARGMIHARRGNIQDYTHDRAEGNLLVTPVGSIVVPGAGYLNTNRTGGVPAAGTAWLFATGIVDVRVDNDISYFPDADGQPGDIDRATNTGTLWAERNVLVSWDGLVHLGVLVNTDT